MIEINRFYYTSTPRSERQKKQERVKILEIIDNIVKCITVDNTIRSEEIYLLDISKIRQ